MTPVSSRTVVSLVVGSGLVAERLRAEFDVEAPESGLFTTGAASVGAGLQLASPWLVSAHLRNCHETYL